MGLWENYLIYWIWVSRNFYQNAIRSNEQWLKLWDTWLKQANRHNDLKDDIDLLCSLAVIFLDRKQFLQNFMEQDI
jgi:hypothetical protein